LPVSDFPFSRSIFFSGLEIVWPVEIGNQRRLSWAPSQPFLRLRARSPSVGTHKVPKDSKMASCLLGRLGDDRYIQAPANCVRDLSKRHALLADRVIPGSRNAFLQRQSV
jgi:hypothetical protein